MCEVFSKEEENTFTRHRIMNDCYAINSGSNTSLVYSRANLDVSELWHRRLWHINYKDLVHIANKDLIKGIPMFSGQPNAIWGECVKGKQVRGSQKNLG